MNNDEKMMITITLTAIILVVGMGVTVSYCVDHMGGGDVTYGTEFDDVELIYIVYVLNLNGGDIIMDDGSNLTVNPADTVVEERGMIKVTHGSYRYYIPPSRIVFVSLHN